MTEVRIPSRVKIQEPRRGELPPGWQDIESVTQFLGERWLRLTGSSVVRVPSAIIPEENNYVINPEHADFRRIEFLASVPFRFDSRLK
jgi:RES domain-containing protein